MAWPSGVRATRSSGPQDEGGRLPHTQGPSRPWNIQRLTAPSQRYTSAPLVRHVGTPRGPVPTRPGARAWRRRVTAGGAPTRWDSEAATRLAAMAAVAAPSSQAARRLAPGARLSRTRPARLGWPGARRWRGTGMQPARSWRPYRRGRRGGRGGGRKAAATATRTETHRAVVVARLAASGARPFYGTGTDQAVRDKARDQRPRVRGYTAKSGRGQARRSP